MQASNWTKSSVSFVSRRLTVWAFSSTKMAWKQTLGKPRQSLNAWPHRRCRVAPFSRYGQLPRSLPSESVFSSPASPREGLLWMWGPPQISAVTKVKECWLLLQHLLTLIQTRLQQWVHTWAAMGFSTTVGADVSSYGLFCYDRPQANCSSDKHLRLIRNTTPLPEDVDESHAL